MFHVIGCIFMIVYGIWWINHLTSQKTNTPNSPKLEESKIPTDPKISIARDITNLIERGNYDALKQYASKIPQNELIVLLAEHTLFETLAKVMEVVFLANYVNSFDGFCEDTHIFKSPEYSFAICISIKGTTVNISQR